MSTRPNIGNVIVHGVTRIRCIVDTEHNCVDIKLDGDGGAAVGGPTITVFGAEGNTPAVAWLTPDEAEAEAKRSFRELLDNSPRNEEADV